MRTQINNLNYSGKPDVFQNLSGSGRLFNYFRTLLRRYDDRNAFLNLFIQPLSSWLKHINISRPQKRSCTRFGIPWFLLDKRCSNLSEVKIYLALMWITTISLEYFSHPVCSRKKCSPGAQPATHNFIVIWSFLTFFWYSPLNVDNECVVTQIFTSNTESDSLVWIKHVS